MAPVTMLRVTMIPETGALVEHLRGQAEFFEALAATYRERARHLESLEHVAERVAEYEATETHLDTGGHEA